MVCVKVTFNSTVRVDAKKEQQPDKISLASFPGVVTVPLIVSLMVNKSSVLTVPTFLIHWNLELTKGQGTNKIFSPLQGFVISRFFFTTITGVKKIVRYTEDFVS